MTFTKKSSVCSLYSCALCGFFVFVPFASRAAGRGGRSRSPPTGQGVAPVDLTGYWVSIIVDEWRFRVRRRKATFRICRSTPKRGRSRTPGTRQRRSRGEAVQGVRRGRRDAAARPPAHHLGQPNTLKIEADAGTQTRLLHFGAAPPGGGRPSWQGYSSANWRVNGRVLIDTGGTGFVPALRQSGTSTSGTLTVVTTNMLPGYIRKNGVPYSDKAVLTEHVNRLTGSRTTPISR